MSRCPDCGLEFACGVAEGKEGAPCWCAQLPALAALPVSTAADEQGKLATCFCPACLKRRIEYLQNREPSLQASGTKSSA